MCASRVLGLTASCAATRVPRLTGIADRVATLEGSIASGVHCGRCSTILTLPVGHWADGSDVPL